MSAAAVIVLPPKMREDEAVVTARTRELGSLLSRHSLRVFRHVRTTERLIAKQKHPFLEGADAMEIYKLLHRRPVAVLSLQRPQRPGPLIMKGPTVPQRIRRETYVALREYCRFKGFFVRLTLGRPFDSWIEPFNRWMATVDNDGQHDPRTIPMHIFEPTKLRSRELRAPEGRDKFNTHYGATNRIDDDGRKWGEEGPMHGTDELTVCGRNLPTGFHWDLQCSGSVVRNPVSEVAVVNYVNVSPDAELRPRPPYAKWKTKPPRK